MKISQKAYNRLTKKQKEVWGPVMQDCLTEYVTAQMLGITRDAVHNRLIKARKRYTTFLKGMR